MTEQANLKIVALKTGPDVVKAIGELLEQAQRGEILSFVGCFEEADAYQCIASTHDQKSTIAMAAILAAWSIRKYGGFS